MLISVVIPFYKELGLINRAVSSAFEQDLDGSSDIAFEAIIGNDGAYDTATILNAIDLPYRGSTRVVRNTGERGPGGARNAALRESRGELIAFLDADDYWRPDKIRLQLQHIEKGDTFVATGYAFEGSAVSITPPRQIRDSLDIFKRLGIGTSTVLVTRSLCGHRFFRPLRFAQDIDYWYALSGSDAFRYAAVSKPCVVYSRGGSTRNKFVQLKAFARVLAINQVPTFARVSISLRYALRGLVNHYIRRG